MTSNRFEELDKSVSPNVAFQRGRAAALFGLDAIKNNPHRGGDGLSRLLRDNWQRGWQRGSEEKLQKDLA